MKRSVATDHTHEPATPDYNGFFSASDKALMDSLRNDKRAYLTTVTHDTTLTGDGTVLSPFGVAIESGSNANGYYVKYPDGTMICGHTLVTSNSVDTTWTYPVAFNSLVSISITAESASIQLLCGQIYSRTVTACVLNVINATARVASVTHLLAFGRWKA